MKKAKKRIMVAVMAAFVLAGCASFTGNAYKTLAVSKQTYTTTLSALGDLFKQNQISESQRDRAVELGRIYKHAHNEATAALLSYEASGSDSDKQGYLRAVKDVSARLADLMDYAKPFIEGGLNK